MPWERNIMRKHDIASILFITCTLTLSAGLATAGTGDRPLNPADVPSEYRKDSAVIDVNLLRKRLMETPRQINTWIDSTYGFQFVYPSHLKPARQFEPAYLDNGSWSWFGEKEKGTPLVSLALPGTPQKTTAAEIRIGVSDDPQTVRECRSLPATAKAGSLKTVRHGDTIYTVFSGSDAAMSKSISVQAYRTVHQNRCYSMELMVSGTNPDVMDPPDYAAMKPDEAMTRLTSLWRQMNFQWLP